MGAIGWRRVRLATVGAGILVAGLMVHGLGNGAVWSFVGDVLYAALIYVLVAFAAPRAQPVVVATVAFGFCAAIEALQLTSIPDVVSRRVPGASLVLGSTFQWSDLAAYVLGAALIAVADPRARA
jgi:uncharacterized protein DUF2809